MENIILVPRRVVPPSPSHPSHQDPPSDTAKHRTFVSTKMVGKPVRSVPGIGKETAKRLVDRGFVKATELFGLFLMNRKNFELLLITCGASQRHQMDTDNAFKEWYDQHM